MIDLVPIVNLGQYRLFHSVCNRNGLIEIVMLDIPDKTVN